MQHEIHITDGITSLNKGGSATTNLEDLEKTPFPSPLELAAFCFVNYPKDGLREFLARLEAQTYKTLRALEDSPREIFLKEYAKFCFLSSAVYAKAAESLRGEDGVAFKRALLDVWNTGFTGD